MGMGRVCVRGGGEVVVVGGNWRGVSIDSPASKASDTVCAKIKQPWAEGKWHKKQAREGKRRQG